MGDYFVHYLLILKIKFIMKKLFFLAAAMCAAVSMNAKDCTWNFTSIFTEAKTFAIGDGQTAEAVVEGELYTYGNGKDKGFMVDVAQSPKYFVDFFTADDQDANKKVARLKSQGTGEVNAKGVFGALAFKVSGNSTITIAAISSSGSAVRKMQVLDGNGNELKSFTFDGNIGKKNADNEIVTEPFVVNYTGAATTIYIVSAPNTEAGAATDGYTGGGINYYKIAATNVADWNSGASLVENAFVAPKATKMMVDGQMIIVRDGVKYNALGTVVE